jgi:hypothetical protein
VTRVTDTEGRFLDDVPTEIRDVLNRHGAGRPQQAPSRDMRNFAVKFLVAMHYDGAVVPQTSATSARRYLRWFCCTIDAVAKKRPHGSTWGLHLVAAELMKSNKFAHGNLVCAHLW